MDIEGLGINTVQQLADAGLVHDLADLYTLTKRCLAPTGRFWRQESREPAGCDCGLQGAAASRLITGLGIRGVGEVAAQDLSRRLRHLDELRQGVSSRTGSDSRIRPQHRREHHRMVRKPR